MPDADTAHGDPTRDDSGEKQLEANEAAAESGQTQDATDAALESIAMTRSADEQREAIQQAEERVLRAQAELENYRKRSRRELEEGRKYAALGLMEDLLSVLDNLDRAVEAAENNENSAGLLEGVKMVSTQLMGVLEKHQCQLVPAEGQEFDPERHEAVGQLPSDTIPAGRIVHVLRPGYQLHDRLVRPSQVMISSGPGPETAEQ